MRLLLLLVTVSALFSSITSAQRAERARTIELRAALPKAAAAESVAAALVNAGYVLAESSPTVVRTERRTFQNVWDLQLRANILAIDSLNTRVVLSGVYWITCCGMLRRDNVAVEESSSGVSGKMWDQLSIAGDRVKAMLPRR